MGYRATNLLLTLREARTINEVFKVLQLVLDGGALLEVEQVSRYSEETGKPAAYTWKPARPDGESVIWIEAGWNIPSVFGFPCAQVLDAIAAPVVSGTCLIRPVSMRSETHGTVPRHVVFERVQVLKGGLRR